MHYVSLYSLTLTTENVKLMLKMVDMVSFVKE